MNVTVTLCRFLVSPDVLIQFDLDKKSNYDVTRILLPRMFRVLNFEKVALNSHPKYSLFIFLITNYLLTLVFIHTLRLKPAGFVLVN